MFLLGRRLTLSPLRGVQLDPPSSYLLFKNTNTRYFGRIFVDFVENLISVDISTLNAGNVSQSP